MTSPFRVYLLDIYLLWFYLKHCGAQWFWPLLNVTLLPSVLHLGLILFSVLVVIIFGVCFDNGISPVKF